jgi:hypothetical protein
MSDLYKIIPSQEFRNTKKVQFHFIPILKKLKAMDRVEHGPNASSPGAVGNVSHPWYMHPHQTDNIMVFHGKRIIELYQVGMDEIETFEVTPHAIEKDGEVLHEGPAMLSWPVNTFHRVKSGEEGSVSVNFAQRTEGFDILTEFNIYDLKPETGEYKVIREGHLDQREYH